MPCPRELGFAIVEGGYTSVHEENWAMAAAYDDPSLGLQLLKVTCVDEIRTLRDRHHLCEHEAGQAATRKETSRLPSSSRRWNDPSRRGHPKPAEPTKLIREFGSGKHVG